MRIRLGIHKHQRVARHQLRIPLRPRPVVQQQIQPPLRIQPEMMIALRADLPVFLQVLLPDDRPARVALDPQAFRAYPPLVHRDRFVDSLFFAFKPGQFRLRGYSRKFIRFALTAATRQKARPAHSAMPLSNQFPVEPKCLSYTDASLPASPSPDPPTPPAPDAHFAPCKSHARAPDAP